MLELKVGDKVKLRRITSICCGCGWESYSSTPYYTRWVVDKVDCNHIILCRRVHRGLMSQFLVYWPSYNILAGRTDYKYHEIYKVNGRLVKDT